MVSRRPRPLSGKQDYDSTLAEGLKPCRLILLSAFSLSFNHPRFQPPSRRVVLLSFLPDPSQSFVSFPCFPFRRAYRWLPMVEKFLPRTQLCLFVYDRAVMLACQYLRSTDPRKADQKKVFLYQRSIRETLFSLLSNFCVQRTGS